MQLNVLPDFSLQRGGSQLEAMRQRRQDPAAERARLEGAAKEFEGIMMELMVKSMRANVPESPIFGRSTGREIFSDMLDSQYARMMVDRGGVGLARLMVSQLADKAH
jgi:flagellar protein FlgJ